MEASKRPWASLLFLLPFIVAYEVGTLVFTRDAATGTETRIIAFTLFQQFLNLFGATGRYLPAAAVIAILLSQHLARGDGWRCKPSTLGSMLAESVCWTLPLLALAMATSRYFPLAGGMPIAVAGEGGGGSSLAAMMVLSIGAGVYEELVFRLIAFALLSLVLSDVLGMPHKRAGLVILVATSVLFSLYHYLGWEDPTWRTFVFRSLAGVFFGALYLWRGFGVTAGTHAVYDLIVVTLAR